MKINQKLCSDEFNLVAWESKINLAVEVHLW